MVCSSGTCKKKDGTYRFCVDYRRLNAVTVKDSHPLPRVDDTLDRLSGAQVFSTIDLTSGYWQIPLHPDDREKTAFSTGAGLYHFKTMPMGICNAALSFQRLMELVLRGLHWSVCLIYLDDIIIHSATDGKHMLHLKVVFDRFRAAGLKLKPSKCHLAKTSVTFLGYIVSKEGVQPDPANTDKLRSWPTQCSSTEVRAFLGICSYYRRFIASFAEIAEPLHHLTHKNVPFLWTENCQAAFDMLKGKLTQPPVMSFPHLEEPFLLYTDASQHAICAVLAQKLAGKEHVIAYASHTLTTAEQKWSTFDRELYAIVWSVRHFQHYVACPPFTIITDHKPLVGLKKMPLNNDPTGRRARWAVELDIYDWRIVHKEGSKHLNADAMSRRPDTVPDDTPTLPAVMSQSTQTSPQLTHLTSTTQPWSPGAQVSVPSAATTNLIDIQSDDWDIRQKQQHDPDLQQVFLWLADGHKPTHKQMCNAPPPDYANSGPSTVA